MWDILSKRTSLEIWHSYSRLPSHPCSVPSYQHYPGHRWTLKVRLEHWWEWMTQKCSRTSSVPDRVERGANQKALLRGRGHQAGDFTVTLVPSVGFLMSISYMKIVIFLSLYFTFLWLLVKLNVYSHEHHLHFFNQFSNGDLRDISIDWKNSLYIYDISLLPYLFQVLPVWHLSLIVFIIYCDKLNS